MIQLSYIIFIHTPLSKHAQVYIYILNKNIYLPTYLPTYLSIYVSIYLSIYLSIYIYIYKDIYINMFEPWTLSIFS